MRKQSIKNDAESVFQKFHLTNRLERLAAITLSTFLVVAATDVAAVKSNSRIGPKVNIKGVAVTGFNRLLGEPIMEMGSFGRFGFATVAAHNPNGGNSMPLTVESAESTLLATDVDPEFLAAFTGPEQPYVVEHASLNLPLRDVPVNIDPSGINFVPIRGILETEPYNSFSPGQREPNWPITLGIWLKAKGKATIKCPNQEHPTVELKMSRLIPNRIYTVWGFFLPDDHAFPMVDLGPIRPLGGVQNAFMADHQGNGRYKRVLNFCPTQLAEGEIPLGTILVMFHSAQQINGGVPSFAGQSRFPGTVAHVHIQFPVSATLVSD